MKHQTPADDAGAQRRRRRLWLLPAALLLALSTYHLWDLYLRPSGTGLTLRLVDLDEARRAIEADEGAIVLDVRLHEDDAPLDRTLRIPGFELERRMDELASHRDEAVYVLAATEEDAAATAALLARRDFERVACIRVPPTAHVRARSGATQLD